jgi:CrcB protein
LALRCSLPESTQSAIAGYYLVTAGGGTPFPLDPTRELVVGGPYACVRNPQAVATLLIVERRRGMPRLFWICFAGALGTGVRHLVALWTAQRLGSVFPYGTLIVNLAGCFIIAVLMQAGMTLGWNATLRAALTIGFVGGLTTYSSFNDDTLRLIEDGSPAAAFANLALTLFGCAVAGWLGLLTTRAVLGH